MARDHQPGDGVSINASRLLGDGIALAREGQRREAQGVFRRVIQIAPELEDGWLWMAWLAETREQGLGYLREGLHFAPHSERLREGIAWVEAHKPATQPAEKAEAAESEPAPSSKPSAKSTRKIARKPRAPRRRAPATGRVVERLSTLRGPRLGSVSKKALGALRGVGITAFSLGAIALLVLLAWVVISQQAGARAPSVSAMVLPTRVLDATPTPSVGQVARPLWTRVEIAWTQEDWNSAINTLEQIRRNDPENVDARARLAQALYFRAKDAIDANELEMAKRDLDRAVRLDADSQYLQRARQDVELYREAVEAYLEQDWARAVFQLTSVYNRTPDFRDTRSMLGQAHCNLAAQQLDKDNLEEALTQANLCEEILEGAPLAAETVLLVEETIRPPKRVEVSLSRFRVTAFENHEPIRDFLVCIGRPSHPTRTGRFTVQSKHDLAYGSAWDLYMPDWIGIYWAGGTENGFHSLPTLSNGQTLWAGALGTRCSFGCIVTGTADGEWLYDFVDIGTVVIIER